MANIAHATICIVWLLVVVVTHNSIVVRSPQTTIPSSQLKGHRLQKVIVFKTLQNSVKINYENWHWFREEDSDHLPTFSLIEAPCGA